VKHQKSHQQHTVTIAIVLLTLLSMRIVTLGWGQVRQGLNQADWSLAPVALLFTAVSYGCLSYSSATISRIFSIRTGGSNLFERYEDYKGSRIPDVRLLRLEHYLIAGSSSNPSHYKSSRSPQYYRSTEGEERA
jgi:hypothetical protein